MGDRHGRGAGLHLPRLGFGGSVIGNLAQRVEADTAAAAVAAAIEGGFTYFDTAPHYGRGLSERRLGDALRGHPQLLVSTKVGRLLLPDASIRDDGERDGFRSPMPFAPQYDYSGDGILRSFEASLHRLGLARVGLLLVHDIGRMTHGDRHDHYWRQLTDGGGFRALERLRDEGVIQGIGIGVNEVAVCLDALQAAPLDVILLAGRYTLLEQEPLDTLFPACLAAGVQVILGGPYNSGILVTGTRDAGHYNYAQAPATIVARVRRMEHIATTHGVPLAAAALQFPLAHPAIACVLPGLRDPEQVARTLEWIDRPIPAAFWDALRADGLLRDDAPTPRGPAA
ncbi:aldo/keto reductase [Sphingomonas sp. KR1UV-12]|uniref:Aldo/keto reductase n=1 Tax=Sphingomonas aurea TaxID=3063994 RepID=A0ABT9ENE4_9SPHN|nr:aldo/keto reductase [Sphingomonas sp. KR1UV-12]MDP1028470.1 aldo/keto reductase [Sphingomonas sp. KR1UV-12]